MADNHRPPNDIIDLTEDDDNPPPLKRVKIEYSDVQVVDAPTQAPITIQQNSAAQSSTSTTNNDVAVVGIKNQVRLPHMRQHCTEFPFEIGHHNHCEDCYCYVCDTSVSRCSSWETHCHATDKGPQAHYYKQLRENKKKGALCSAVTPAVPTTVARRNHQDQDTPPVPPHYNNKDFSSPYEAGQNSPYPPSTTYPHPSTTQCRHCQWYSVLKGNNSYHVYSASFCFDWCQACGRVASAAALGQYEGNELQDTVASMYLGMKTIEYKVHAHDPRNMTPFKKYYEEHNFPFDEVDTAEEFVQHRLGNFPTLRTILKTIPMGGTSATIPKNGAIRSGYGESSKPNADDTQAITVQPDDLVLLQVLHNAAESFGKNLPNSDILGFLSGDIRNKYDRESQAGTLTIRAFARSITGKSHSSTLKLAKFLGVWFGVLPFGLEEINLHLKVNSRNDLKFRRPKASVQKEMGLTEAGIKEAATTARKEIRESFKAHYKMVKSSRSEHLSLTSGSGNKNVGGICLGGTDFRSMILRLFREIVADCVALQQSNSKKPYYLTPFLSAALKIPSCHRMGDYGFADSLALEPFLGPKDAKLVGFSTQTAANEIVNNRVKSLNGLVDQLENLGHAPAPFVEGLTVELLPFQSQSLQWALERETTPGGVQSFFWTKLPNTQVYYNPILGHLTKEKPKLVRGGIVAEQMGLGKTVISLALILQNPAPVVPEAGSNVSTIPAQIPSNGPFRDPDLYERTKDESDSRGSIISRGTLVVCPVSLVGQWIEEAKSKLKDPGLVYSYHGGNRKRDPATLAQNAIVVTTYETLASDATFHRSKSDDPTTYCPPCEQIRWWRILCDESHGLRNPSNGKSRAVMQLVADNKWLVSGTPLSTTVVDLKNQLKFLGIEHHSALMDVFKETLAGRVNDSSRPSKRSRSWHGSSEKTTPGLGYFQFLMRPLLMRHSQNQKYLDTETGLDTQTTLMSLPPKTERTIVVQFGQKEKKEYDKVEKAAQDFYTKFAESHKEELTKHFLKLSAKLGPMRIACAGGKIPLDDPVSDKKRNGDREDHDEDVEEQNTGNKRAKKKHRFSDFAFTSKFQTLIKELCRLRDTDTSAKSLVFSQYTSTLKWLQDELPTHGFQFRTLSGDMNMRSRAKALRDFQNDPPTTIFLLSMRAGAVGINLTQANRVFLMEPCFNPALEAQAIGRVHRLGQKRPVEIIRLVVKDSVETRIQKMLHKKFGSPTAKKPPPSNEKSTTTDEDKDSKEDQKKRAKKAAGPKSPPKQQEVFVGSISSDKLEVMTDEFDLLFGVSGRENSVDPVDSKPSASDPTHAI